MQYFNQIKNRRRSSQIPRAPSPVLTDEDEAYLRQVISQSENGPSAPGPSGQEVTGSINVPAESTDSQGAHGNSVPASPAEEFGKELGERGRRASQKSELTETTSEATKVRSTGPLEKKKRWSAMFWKRNTEAKKDKEPTDDTQTQSEIFVNSTPSNAGDPQKDQEDMTDILERLNLAADNNYVFSFSDETQELLRKFKLIFKDLINGVPTAYHDLEMLLTNGNRQLQDTYTKLPGFLQKLIEKLPEKWTETLAPEMLAVASERAARSGINMEQVGKAAAAAEKMGVNMPSLKELVSKPAAIVGMLRSIMAFLRARFPAVMGMNVLWSLALTILLFVLWYCHKRGREVRLENERLVTEEEINKLNENSSESQIRTTETLTTTAPPGASSEEVRDGVKKVEQARAAQVLKSAASEPSTPNGENVRPTTVPTRSKSRLSIWGRPKPEPTSNITPYPGT